MKSLPLTIAILTSSIALNAYATTKNDAVRVVKKYSETVACQTDESPYKAVTIQPGEADMNDLGAVFVVYWEGDLGCAGGTGTVVPNFTVVEQSGFSSAPPVVKTDYKFPNLDLVEATNISAEEGILTINGITYGPDDQQHFPTKKVSYKLKFDFDGFTIQ